MIYLSLLLFFQSILLYINDIHTCSSLLSFILFADDTNLFISGKNLETLVNREMKRVQVWLKLSDLAITPYIPYVTNFSPTSDFRLLTSDFRLLTSNFGLQSFHHFPFPSSKWARFLLLERRHWFSWKSSQSWRLTWHILLSKYIEHQANRQHTKYYHVQPHRNCSPYWKSHPLTWQ